MKSYRNRGLGCFVSISAAAITIGGCSGPTRGPTTAKSPAVMPAETTDDSHWQVSAPSGPKLLAGQTARYAQSFADDGKSGGASPQDPQVQFPTPKQPKRVITLPLDDGEPTITDAPPQPQGQPTQQSQSGLDRSTTAETASSAMPDPAPRVALDAPRLPNKPWTKYRPATPPAQAQTTPQPQPDAPAADPNDSAKIFALQQAAQGLGEGPHTVPESADFPPKTRPQSAADPLEFRLQKRARDNPHDIAAQLDLRLYAMLKDEQTPELAADLLLPHQDQEMINTLVDGLTEFRSAVREDETMLQPKKIAPLIEMSKRLRSEADLSIPTVALCKRVVGFGNYDPIEPARFPAGQSSKLIVYCEVENFKSKRISSQTWETKLTQQVTLFTDAGQFVWEDKPRTIQDDSRRQRADFYAYELLRLPPDLTIGRYLLKVSITDENAGKYAQATVPVAIGAQEVTEADR